MLPANTVSLPSVTSSAPRVGMNARLTGGHPGPQAFLRSASGPVTFLLGSLPPGTILSCLLDWLSHIQVFPLQSGADTTKEAGLPSPRGQLGNKALRDLESPAGPRGMRVDGVPSEPQALPSTPLITCFKSKNWVCRLARVCVYGEKKSKPWRWHLPDTLGARRGAWVGGEGSGSRVGWSPLCARAAGRGQEGAEVHSWEVPCLSSQGVV